MHLALATLPRQERQRIPPKLFQGVCSTCRPDRKQRHESEYVRFPKVTEHGVLHVLMDICLSAHIETTSQMSAHSAFTHLSLPLLHAATGANFDSVKQALDPYLEPATVQLNDWVCHNCVATHPDRCCDPPMQQRCISGIPQLLVIHLKRWGIILMLTTPADKTH